MKSRASADFWAAFNALPRDVQEQAIRAYKLFKADPKHPSLQFKQVSPRRPLYSVRIGSHYRAIGLRIAKDLIVWDWIGTHREYEKRIG